MPKHMQVVAAVINHDGLILCTQRGTGPLTGLWEFPGGKVEQGESPAIALRREIAEELSCDIEVGEEITTTTHTYEFAVVTLSTFFCRLTRGTPTLTEHSAARWMHPAELPGLDWAPADLPAVAAVQARLS